MGHFITHECSGTLHSFAVWWLSLFKHCCVVAEQIEPSLSSSSSSCSWKEQLDLGLLRDIKVSSRASVSRKALGSPVGHKHDTCGCKGMSDVHTSVNVWMRDQSMLTGKLFVLAGLCIIPVQSYSPMYSRQVLVSALSFCFSSSSWLCP